MKTIADMTEPELKDFFRDLARQIEGLLPPGPSNKGKCLFALIVADTLEPGVGQYVANMVRADDPDEAKRLALRELRRTSFPDRNDSMWRVEKVEVLCG